MAGRFSRAQLTESMNHHPSRWHFSQQHFEHHSSATVDCDGHQICTIVTASPCVVRQWLFRMRRYHINRLLRSRLLVGVGVQWTPLRIRGHQNPPATLQLCIGQHCLIFQLSHAPRVPQSLRRFLSDPDITFVGVNNRRDNDLLMNSSPIDLCLSIPNLIDLVDVAEESRGYGGVISMETLANLELQIQVRKDPEVGRSCWDGYYLSDAQVQYASVDAYVSFLLGKSLRAWNWNAGEEFEGDYDGGDYGEDCRDFLDDDYYSHWL